MSRSAAATRSPILRRRRVAPAMQRCRGIPRKLLIPNIFRVIPEVLAVPILHKTMALSDYSVTVRTLGNKQPKSLCCIQVLLAQ
jgi:hypothetical protein